MNLGPLTTTTCTEYYHTLVLVCNMGAQRGEALKTKMAVAVSGASRPQALPIAPGIAQEWLGTGMQDMSEDPSLAAAPFAALEALVSTIHCPPRASGSAGIAHVLHSCTVPQIHCGMTFDKRVADVSIPNIALYCDFLTVVTLDLVDAPAELELEKKLATTPLWEQLCIAMDWLIAQSVCKRVDGVPTEHVIRLLSCANRLAILLRLVFLLGGLTSDSSQDQVLARTAQIREWISALMLARKDLRVHSTFMSDEQPSALIELQVVQLQACFSSLLPTGNGDDEEAGSVGESDEEVAHSPSVPNVQTKQSLAAGLLPFAWDAEPDPNIFVAARALGVDSRSFSSTARVSSEEFDHVQYNVLYHAIAVAETCSLRRQCTLASVASMPGSPEVHETTLNRVHDCLEQLCNLLDPAFMCSYLVQRATSMVSNETAVMLPAPSQVALQASTQPVPWELAGRYGLLLAELVLGETYSRSTTKPLDAKLIALCIKGTPRDAEQGAPLALGLIDLLPYSRPPIELSQNWPMSQILDWASTFCDQPDIMLQTEALEPWAADGIELIKRLAIEPIGKLPGDAVEFISASSLGTGLMSSIGELFNGLAPASKAVLAPPSRQRTRLMVELLANAAQVHDVCKGLLRVFARTATSGAIAAGHSLRIFAALERVMCHPLFFSWPKRFIEGVEARMRFVRGAISAIQTLRRHAVSVIERIKAANQALDSHFGTLLSELRKKCLCRSCDLPDEVNRRAALHRVAAMSQMMIQALMARFEAGQGNSEGKRQKLGGAVVNAFVEREGAFVDEVAEQAVASFDDALGSILECAEITTSTMDAATSTFGLTDMGHRGKVTSTKGIHNSKSPEVVQAAAQLLELARMEIRPVYEALFERTIGQLQGVGDEQLDSIQMALTDTENEFAIGSLEDTAEEFAEAMAEDTMDDDLAGVPNLAAGAASKAAKSLYARRRAKPKMRGRASDALSRPAEAKVREVAAWSAVRVASALCDDLSNESVRKDWKGYVQPIFEELQKAIFVRQINEFDPGVRKALYLDTCAGRVNSACKEQSSHNGSQQPRSAAQDSVNNELPTTPATVPPATRLPVEKVHAFTVSSPPPSPPPSPPSSMSSLRQQKGGDKGAGRVHNKSTPALLTNTYSSLSRSTQRPSTASPGGKMRTPEQRGFEASASKLEASSSSGPLPRRRPLGVAFGLASDRRLVLAASALGEVEIHISRELTALEEKMAAVWEAGHGLVRFRRDERSHNRGAGAPKLHESRSLMATAQALRTLMWMQEEVISSRQLKLKLMDRLSYAWTFVGREAIQTHLLDVLEARAVTLNSSALQNLVDVEQGWLFSRTVAPQRTGGGFHREGRKLREENAWLHNLQVRHENLEVRSRGPSVPAPLEHGLRYDASREGLAFTPLWPGAKSTPSSAWSGDKRRSKWML